MSLRHPVFLSIMSANGSVLQRHAPGIPHMRHMTHMRDMTLIIPATERVLQRPAPDTRGGAPSHNFSKVSSTLISHNKLSSKPTFENFYLGGR